MRSSVADAPLAVGALRTPVAPVPGVGSRCYARGVFLDPPDVASTSAPSPGVDELAARIWRGSDLVIAIGLVLLAIVIVSAGVAALYAAGVIADRGELFDTPVLLITIAFELSLGLIVVGLARRRGLGARDLGFVYPRRWWPLWVAVFGAFGIVMLYGLALVLAQALGFEVSALQEGNIPSFTGERSLPVYLLAVFTIVVVAPINEELFFRGLAFRALFGSWGVEAGIMGSALMFALFHFDLNVFVPFAAIGALFAYSYRESRSLWTPIAAHTIFNGVNLALGT